MKSRQKLPLENYGIKHIAFILDGNGRWAKARNKPRTYGHARGFSSLFEVALAVNKRAIEVMSVYAFSTENWNRPLKEIRFLFQTLEKKLTSMLKKVQKHGIKIRTAGDLSKLPETTQKAIAQAVNATASNSNMILNICINYGGHDEIIRAIKKLHRENSGDDTFVTNLTPAIFETFLDSNGLPAIDLLVRTSGEQRLSNFMLWQMAYAELIFTPTMWPDYNEETLVHDLSEYAKRTRRFGGL